jgi:predicted DNA-binding antitoxin AbrB/MazE fold protein
MLCLLAFRTVEEVEMSQTITAIYANGVLRPLTPLELPDQAEVEIEVRPIAKPNKAAIEERIRIHHALIEAGLIIDTGLWQAEPVIPISPEEEEELGRTFASDKPLSEIIIEEREGRF